MNALFKFEFLDFCFEAEWHKNSAEIYNVISISDTLFHC